MPASLLKALEAYARRFGLRSPADILAGKPVEQPWRAK